MRCIKADPALGLRVIVSGTHLSPKFRMTVHEIEAEGIKVNRKIALELAGNSAAGNAKSIGRGITRFATAFRRCDRTSSFY